MSNNSEKRRLSLKEKLLINEDIDLGADFYIEMRGAFSVSVRGCCGIAEYGTQRIVLKTRKNEIMLEGEDLICDSYTNGAVIISGRVRTVSFCKGDNRKI